jgi:hypothetical protein
VIAEKHWIGPDLWSVEVDWDKVRKQTATLSEAWHRKFHARAGRSMQAEINWLISIMEQAEDNHDEFYDKMVSAQHKTMQNVDRSVHIGEVGVQVSTMIRDVSAEFVMAGASVLDPALIPYAVAAGSAMKGVFQYQDTGRAGQAVATFSANLILGIADVKATASIAKLATKSERLGMTIVWAKAKGASDIPKGVIEGKDFKKAAVTGAVKMATATPREFGNEALKAILDSKGISKAWAVPVQVALDHLEDKGAEIIAESGVEEAHQTNVHNALPMTLPHPHRNHHLMDTFLYDHSVIEKSAIRKIGSGPQA